MATQLTGTSIQAVGQPLYSSSATQFHNLGEMTHASDGRSFRYCKMGAVAGVPGKLYQAPAEITTHQNLTPAAAAIGATQITVALGATLASANQYAGGFAIITVTPGQGYAYKIKSHPAAALSTSVVLTLEDSVLVALTTSSHVDLVPNKFSGVLVNPTTATSMPVGACIYLIAISEFGWLQTGGVCPLLVDDQTVVVGTNVAASNQAAGAIEPATGVQAAVGEAQTGGATTEYVAVDIRL